MTAAPGFNFGKLVVLFLYLVIAAVSNWCVLAYIHDFVPRDPLPDLIFWLVPQQDWAFDAGNTVVNLSLSFVAVLLIFHKARLVILRRAIFIIATLYFLRSLSLLLTQLPSGYANNSELCRNASASPSLALFIDRVLQQAKRFGVQQKSAMLCGDMMFSGHSLVMKVCSLTVYHYLPSRFRVLGWLPILMAYVGMFFMIISRVHYTIDVVYACWMSNFIFASYHNFCESCVSLGRKRAARNCCWGSGLVAWLEADIALGNLDNKLCDPLEELRHWSGCKRTQAARHKQLSTCSETALVLA